MADPRDTGGVSPLARRAVPPPPRTTTPTPTPTSDTASTAGPVSYVVSREVGTEGRDSEPKARAQGRRPARRPAQRPAARVGVGQGWTPKTGNQFAFRVRVPTAMREALKHESMVSCRPFGVIAYEAVARNTQRLRDRLGRVDQPDMSLAPIRRPRMTEPGGSPKVDLYLNVEERDSINKFAAELDVTPSVLFRAALDMWFQTTANGTGSVDGPVQSGGSGPQPEVRPDA